MELHVQLLKHQHRVSKIEKNAYGKFM